MPKALRLYQLRLTVLRYFTAVLILVSASLTATPIFAGPEYDDFLVRVAAYNEAQRQQPEQLIRYDDENGEVIRQLFAPANATSIGKMGQLNEIELGNLNEATKTLKDIAAAYGEAFQKSPSQFEREHLDSFESMIRMVSAGLVPLLSIDLSSVKDENMRQMIQASQKLAVATPRLMIMVIAEEVENDVFTDAVANDAKERLVSLESYLNELGVSPQ